MVIVVMLLQQQVAGVFDVHQNLMHGVWIPYPAVGCGDAVPVKNLAYLILPAALHVQGADSQDDLHLLRDDCEAPLCTPKP